MNQIVSNECKANLEIIVSFMGIVGGIYGGIVVGHQFGLYGECNTNCVIGLKT